MKYGERAPQSGKTKIANRLAAQPASLAGRLAGAKDVRLVFFGTENFSAPTLSALIGQGWPILAVVTKPNAKQGRGQKLAVPPVKKIALRAGLRVFQPGKVADIEADLAKLRPTHGVLVAYGQIIPDSILKLFRGGIINLHPSLLPKYRGPSPIEAAILNGDKQTGLSLMRLTAGMDEGPVYYQSVLKLKGSENRLELSKKMAKMGADRLIERLPQIIDGRLKPVPQDNSKATYTPLLKKEDGAVNFSQPAEVIERQIRAYLGWPRSRATIFGKEVVITKASLVKDRTTGLVIQCNPGLLQIEELIAPSGRTISGVEFIRGYSL
ncbi:MAG: methionyl-tRNA formyltransferase [Candidatus Saccharimonadales bacterium]